MKHFPECFDNIHILFIFMSSSNAIVSSEKQETGS